MKLNKLGNNKTELITEYYKVLVSYSTPVAVYTFNDKQLFKTSTKYSNTTTKHINSWIESNKPSVIISVGQDHITNLVENLKATKFNANPCN